MIAHVVLFRPRRDLSGADREAFAAAFEQALAAIPAIRRARVGRRLPGEDTPESARDYPYAAVLEFDSAADLGAYFDHPAHQTLGRRFYDSSEAVLFADYEWLDGREVGRLIVGDGARRGDVRPLRDGERD